MIAMQTARQPRQQKKNIIRAPNLPKLLRCRYASAKKADRRGAMCKEDGKSQRLVARKRRRLSLGGSLIPQSHSLNNPNQKFSNLDDEEVLSSGAQMCG
jgi:hypothetical protein